MEKLLNYCELAELLGLSPQTIRTWVSMKKIPFLKINGAVRFSQQEIDEIIKSSREKSKR